MFYLHIRNLAFVYFLYFDFKVLDAKVVEVPMTGYQGKVLLGDEQEILVFCCRKKLKNAYI